MNEIFIILIIVCMGIDIYKLIKGRIDFAFWYKSFVLLVIDKFLLKANLSIVSDILIFYFAIANFLIFKNLLGFTNN